MAKESFAIYINRRGCCKAAQQITGAKRRNTGRLYRRYCKIKPDGTVLESLTLSEQ